MEVNESRRSAFLTRTEQGLIRDRASNDSELVFRPEAVTQYQNEAREMSTGQAISKGVWIQTLSRSGFRIRDQDQRNTSMWYEKVEKALRSLAETPRDPSVHGSLIGYITEALNEAGWVRGVTVPTIAPSAMQYGIRGHAEMRSIRTSLEFISIHQNFGECAAGSGVPETPDVFMALLCMCMYSGLSKSLRSQRYRLRASLNHQ